MTELTDDERAELERFRAERRAAGLPRRSGVVLLLPAAIIRAFAADADAHGDTLADACVRLVRRALGMPAPTPWYGEDGPEDPVAVERLKREAHEQGMAEGPGRPEDRRRGDDR